MLRIEMINDKKIAATFAPQHGIMYRGGVFCGAKETHKLTTPAHLSFSSLGLVGWRSQIELES